jgi:hypothetical protein
MRYLKEALRTSWPILAVIVPLMAIAILIGALT